MSKVNLNREEGQSTGAIRIPTDNYKLRIVEEPKFQLTKPKADKPQRPMLVFKLELVEPASKIIDGEEVTLAGLEFTTWVVIFVNEDGTEASPSLTAIHKQGNLPMEFSRSEDTGLPVDDNGVPISYAGIELHCKCSSEEYVERNDDGEEMRNPITGEVLKGYNRKVNRIY